jgi:hypothetical protein
MFTICSCRSIWLPLLVALLAGCGDGLPQRAPVAGRVTYQGRSLEIGQIVFVPERGRSAFGKIRNSKIVDVTTFEKGDGVIVGNSKIGIKCVTNMDSIVGPHEPMIPTKYFDPDSAGLSTTIRPGELNKLNFELAD